MKTALRPFIWPSLWGTMLAALIVQVARGRWPKWVLVVFLFVSLGLAIVTPTVGRVRETSVSR